MIRLENHVDVTLEALQVLLRGPSALTENALVIGCEYRPTERVLRVFVIGPEQDFTPQGGASARSALLTSHDVEPFVTTPQLALPEGEPG